MEFSVSLFLVSENAGRFAVVQSGADVEAIAVIGDANLGFLRGRSTLLRLSLKEVLGWDDPIPKGLIESAVETNVFVLGQGTSGDRSFFVRFSPSRLQRKKEKKDYKERWQKGSFSQVQRCTILVRQVTGVLFEFELILMAAG